MLAQTDAYTLAEVEAAALRIGLDGQTPALLAELQEGAGLRYSRGNAQDGDNPYHDMASGLLRLYERFGTWEAVGRMIGKSRAYAWRVAHGDLTPSAEALACYQAYTSRG